MKAKAQAKFVMSQQGVELIETAERRSYHDLRHKLKMAAAGIVKQMVDTLQGEGILIQRVGVKISEETMPTIDEIKTEFTVDVTVEGKPYERASREIA